VAIVLRHRSGVAFVAVDPPPAKTPAVMTEASLGTTGKNPSTAASANSTA
jgi:hypothetical protein